MFHFDWWPKMKSEWYDVGDDDSTAKVGEQRRVTDNAMFFTYEERKLCHGNCHDWS